MTNEGLRRLGLALALVGGVTALEGCAKKGKGEGKRDTLPTFADRGTVQDDGPKTQNPPPPPGGDPADKDPPTPGMSPEARKIPAECFGLAEADVAEVVGWTDTATSRDAANGVCALLAKAGYNKGAGASTTAAAVDLDK